MGLFTKALTNSVREALTGERSAWYNRPLGDELQRVLALRIEQILASSQTMICPHGQPYGIDAVEIRWGATADEPFRNALPPWSGWSGTEPGTVRVPPQLVVRYACKHGDASGTFSFNDVVILRAPARK